MTADIQLIKESPRGAAYVVPAPAVVAARQPRHVQARFAPRSMMGGRRASMKAHHEHVAVAAAPAMANQGADARRAALMDSRVNRLASHSARVVNMRMHADAHAKHMAMQRAEAMQAGQHEAARRRQASLTMRSAGSVELSMPAVSRAQIMLPDAADIKIAPLNVDARLNRVHKTLALREENLRHHLEQRQDRVNKRRQEAMASRRHHAQEMQGVAVKRPAH